MAIYYEKIKYLAFILQLLRIGTSKTTDAYDDTP